MSEINENLRQHEEAAAKILRSMSAPGPSVEQMIEEIGEVYVGVTDGRWWAIENPGCAICHGHAHQRRRHGWLYVEDHESPKAAVSALYRAWRERE